MMWRPMDPGHPAYDPVKDPPFADAVPSAYEEADRLVTYALDHVDKDTLVIAMSDHGFTSWRRTFHLNAWLHQHGYLAVKDESLPAGRELLTNVDWTRTRAYGFGLNGLYVNLQGREKYGIVPIPPSAMRCSPSSRRRSRPRSTPGRRSPPSATCTCGTRRSATAASVRSAPTR